MNKQRRGFLKQGLLASAAVLSSRDLLAESFHRSANHLPSKVDLTVFNAGVGGNNTVDLLNRIEKDCLALKPRLTIHGWYK
jgi:hypothetical protein